MSHATAAALFRQVRGLVAAQAADAAPDPALLERFRIGDAAAFEALVRRHGPMVLRVCRRVLGNPHDAEDAFQATFLVLAQKAGAIRKGASVASWLHGVAYRVSCKARARLARPRPMCGRPPAQGDAADEVSWREVRSVLDAELGQLPEECRAPLVLCYLEGLTQDEAARRLGWSGRTLRRRLGQGRRLLRARLARRGLGLSAGLGAVLLAEAAAPAALPPAPIKGVVPARVAALARGAVGVGCGKAKLAAALLLAAVAFGGAGAAARQLLAASPAAEERAEAPAAADQAPRAGTDRYGDPLPPGALLRLGTVRFRHGLGVYSVAYSPDGRLIASTGGDGAVRLWDAATGRLVREVTRRPQREATFAVFSPDGTLLACGGPQEQGPGTKPKAMAVYLYEVATGKEVRRLEGHGPALCGAAFAPGGKTLATTERGGIIRLWEVSTGKEVRCLKGAGNALAFSPDGKLLACGGGMTVWDRVKPRPGGGDVRVWDVASGDQLHHLAKEQRQVTAVAFSADGKLLASASEDQTIRLWDVATGKERQQLVHEMTGRHAHNGIQALAAAPRGTLLASGGADGVIRLWDASTGKELRRLSGHHWWVVALALSPDGKTLASGSWDGTIRQWDVTTGKEVRPSDEHQNSVRAAPSSDGKFLVTAGHDDTVRLWDAATGRRRLTLRAGPGEVTAAALSPDGKALATGGKDMAVRVWDLGAGKVVRTLTGHKKDGKDGEVDALAFSPDGKLLVSAGSHDQTVIFWDAAAGKELRRVTQRGVSQLAFAPGGKTLFAGGWDGTARLWDVAAGKELRVFKPAPEEGAREKGIVDTVAVSPDGALLATAGHDGAIQLWDVAAGEERRRLRGHDGVVWAVAFSPDGKLLASGGLDMTVRLWEVATGKEVHRLKGHSGWVLSVAFLPDGKSVLSGAIDTTALLWSLSPGATAAGLQAKAPMPAELDRFWADLAGPDARRAYRASWALAETPAAAVPFLGKQLRPVVLPNAERLRRLIADLDSDIFATREAATMGLAKLGASAAPALRTALKDNPSAEVRRRAAALLTTLREAPSPEALRNGRAVAALERMGTSEARRLLEALAKGAPGAALTDDARGALKRLGKASAP
ncbi:MAG TPA: sigma-70 family RNA polymerase sigma factor [Gemmataceae bacterium]|jgi:RNA polymerase sigma factor (sigma-70 family)|nr:sigma-70 family RNA polymerase sigma factor [Gemmataceae bacterium]